MSDLRADHFLFVRQMVHQRAGIVLEDGKEYLVETRLATVARTHGIPMGDLIDRARRDPRSPLNDDIVEAMTTNETSFFRDFHPFNTLRDTVLPQLIRARSATRRLRILSGAASTGQEAYSVAMLIAHHFPELSTWNVEILGTDISREALDKARTARYSQLEVNRGLPATMLRYFNQEGRDWVVEDAVRRLVRFQELNLVEPWPAFEAQDLVMMRNVLIYFDAATKQSILHRIRTVMAPDGVLLLGSTETALNMTTDLMAVRLGQSTIYAPEATGDQWASPALLAAG